MSDYNLEDDYRKLLNIEAAKHRVEHILLGCLIASAVGIGVLLFIQNHELNLSLKTEQTVIKNQENAAAARQKLIVTLTQQLQKQSMQTDDVVLCLGDFFAQPDRTNLTISNLQECKINVNAFSTAGALPSQSSTSSTPPAKEPTTSEPPKTPATAAVSPTPSPASSSSSTSPSTTSSQSGHPGVVERVVTFVKRIL